MAGKEQEEQTEQQQQQQQQQSVRPGSKSIWPWKKESDGSASFLRAARAGNLEKVLEFLKTNTDINTCNANGLNALHLASKEGHVHVVTELLQRGASVDAATKKGNTALHIASLAGQEEIVKVLVQHQALVNIQSQNGFTPLYMAAQENHDNVVRFLLANNANQSLATEDGFTPLAVALQQGHDKVVAVLLENDTRGKVRLPALHIAAKKDDTKAAALLLHTDHNPDVTSKSGFTPLHIAAHYGNENIANLLIQRGADVNYIAKHQITPLHVASKWGKGNMVSLLIDKGANYEAKTRDGLTPLHCAARSGHETVVDMLLEKGAPITSKTKNGLAPLHMASQGDHVDAARILLYHKAPVDDVTVDYLTALHVAAHCGHVRVAKLLLDRKADPNSRALNGFTPLHIACKKNRIKVVELLLKHGASIEATTESGLTPLHVASFMGCMNIVIYLIQHGASADVPTVRGETPLHLAARANQTDIIRILLRNGAQVDARAREQQTALHIASRLGNSDIVVLLLQHGAAVDATTKDHYTALHIAAKEGQEEVASVLLEHGASLTSTTKKGFTPLHLAAKYGNMKVARLLLQKDAPVDAQGKNGVTPLHVAAHYDHQNVALLLLDKTASPHATAKNGYTPLHIAARKNQMDIATTLLEFGASANAESKAGFTPLHLSSQEGHTDMATLLIEHNASPGACAKNGLTPLHLCAQEDRVNVAAILVKHGAQIDPVTKAGYTPLHVASHFGQMNMVRFLLQHGSKVDSTTQLGYTPLHQAAQQGHTQIVNLLLENKAEPNAETNDGKTALSIAQRLGYISVVETLKIVTETTITTTTTTVTEEKYKVVVPETMHETFMSESEDEGGDDNLVSSMFGKPQHVTLPYYEGQFRYTSDDTMLGDQSYRYLTVDEMKSLGDDSLPIDVTKDEKMDVSFISNSMAAPPVAPADQLSPQHQKEQQYAQFTASYPSDNVDIAKTPILAGFLVSFMVDARGGAMRGCRHSGVRVIIPPRKAAMPMRITCRYLKKDKLVHAPPLMEGEALASRILEMGPAGAKFLGPVIIEVPHFASLRGKEREIVILRSDNGETWREHTLEATEEAVQEVLNESFDGEELKQLEDLNTNRITRILTTDFPQYFAIVTRIRQEVHAIGPEGGMVSSTVVPQVQAVFPQGALTKKIKVGLQAQPIPTDLVAKLLGNRVAVSPIVTVEPRRRKFHKPITLTIPVPQAASKGMINQYSGEAPTLRLLCSITGGTTRAQWEDVTGSTPLTFVNDCVSFTTTVSARFWLMDCSNIPEATKMATELYREAIHVPFMAKFVVFSKRHQLEEARVRVFCMTDDREDKTLEHQEMFVEVAKSRDVEVLEGKPQFLEFAGNLVPVTKSGDQLAFNFYAFRENRLPFTVRVKDQHADCIGRVAFMRQPKVGRGDPPQTPICNLNIALPDNIQPEPAPSEPDLLALEKKYSFLSISKADTIHKADLRLTDISNMLGTDWVGLARELEISDSDINIIKSQYPDNAPQQAIVMLRLWMQTSGNKANGNTLEKGLRKIGRDDIVNQCIFNVELVTDDIERAMAKAHLDQSGFEAFREELGPSRDATLNRDISLDVSYDEQDMMKEAESAEEEEENQRTYQEKTSREQRAADMSPTYESEEKKYAGEEKIVAEEKVTKVMKEEPTVIATTTIVEQPDVQSKKEAIITDVNKEVIEEKAPVTAGPTEKMKEQMAEKVEEKFVEEKVEEKPIVDIDKHVEVVDKLQESKYRLDGKVSEAPPPSEMPEDKILTTTKVVEGPDGTVSTTTTTTTERRSFVTSDDGAVQEHIVIEKRTAKVVDGMTAEEDKSDILQRLGEELGRLDEKLEEKFKEKRKTEEPEVTREEVSETSVVATRREGQAQPTSQVVVEHDPSTISTTTTTTVKTSSISPTPEGFTQTSVEKSQMSSTRGTADVSTAGTTVTTGQPVGDIKLQAGPVLTPQMSPQPVDKRIAQQDVLTHSIQDQQEVFSKVATKEEEKYGRTEERGCSPITVIEGRTVEGDNIPIRPHSRSGAHTITTTTSWGAPVSTTTSIQVDDSKTDNCVQLTLHSESHVTLHAPGEMWGEFPRVKEEEQQEDTCMVDSSEDTMSTKECAKSIDSGKMLEGVAHDSGKFREEKMKTSLSGMQVPQNDCEGDNIRDSSNQQIPSIVDNRDLAVSALRKVDTSMLSGTMEDTEKTPISIDEIETVKVDEATPLTSSVDEYMIHSSPSKISTNASLSPESEELKAVCDNSLVLSEDYVANENLAPSAHRPTTLMITSNSNESTDDADCITNDPSKNSGENDKSQDLKRDKCTEGMEMAVHPQGAGTGHAAAGYEQSHSEGGAIPRSERPSRPAPRTTTLVKVKVEKRPVGSHTQIRERTHESPPVLHVPSVEEEVRGLMQEVKEATSQIKQEVKELRQADTPTPDTPTPLREFREFLNREEEQEQERLPTIKEMCRESEEDASINAGGEVLRGNEHLRLDLGLSVSDRSNSAQFIHHGFDESIHPDSGYSTLEGYYAVVTDPSTTKYIPSYNESVPEGSSSELCFKFEPEGSSSFVDSSDVSPVESVCSATLSGNENQGKSKFKSFMKRVRQLTSKGHYKSENGGGVCQGIEPQAKETPRESLSHKDYMEEAMDRSSPGNVTVEQPSQRSANVDINLDEISDFGSGLEILEKGKERTSTLGFAKHLLGDHYEEHVVSSTLSASDTGKEEWEFIRDQNKPLYFHSDIHSESVDTVRKVESSYKSIPVINKWKNTTEQKSSHTIKKSELYTGVHCTSTEDFKLEIDFSGLESPKTGSPLAESPYLDSSPTGSQYTESLITEPSTSDYSPEGIAFEMDNEQKQKEEKSIFEVRVDTGIPCEHTIEPEYSELKDDTNSVNVNLILPTESIPEIVTHLRGAANAAYIEKDDSEFCLKESSLPLETLLEEDETEDEDIHLEKSRYNTLNTTPVEEATNTRDLYDSTSKNFYDGNLQGTNKPIITPSLVIDKESKYPYLEVKTSKLYNPTEMDYSSTKVVKAKLKGKAGKENVRDNAQHQGLKVEESLDIGTETLHQVFISEDMENIHEAKEFSISSPKHATVATSIHQAEYPQNVKISCEILGSPFFRRVNFNDVHDKTETELTGSVVPDMHCIHITETASYVSDMEIKDKFCIVSEIHSKVMNPEIESSVIPFSHEIDAHMSVAIQVKPLSSQYDQMRAQIPVNVSIAKGLPSVHPDLKTATISKETVNCPELMEKAVQIQEMKMPIDTAEEMSISSYKNGEAVKLIDKVCDINNQDAYDVMKVTDEVKNEAQMPETKKKIDKKVDSSVPQIKAKTILENIHESFAVASCTTPSVSHKYDIAKAVQFQEINEEVHETENFVLPDTYEEHNYLTPSGEFVVASTEETIVVKEFKSRDEKGKEFSEDKDPQGSRGGCVNVYFDPDFHDFSEISVNKPELRTSNSVHIGKQCIGQEKVEKSKDLFLPVTIGEKARINLHQETTSDFDIAVVSKGKVIRCCDILRTVDSPLVTDSAGTKVITSFDSRQRKAELVIHKEPQDFDVAVVNKAQIYQPYETQRSIQSQTIKEEMGTTGEIILPEIYSQKGELIEHGESLGVALTKKDKVIQPYETEKIAHSQVVEEDLVSVGCLTIPNIKLQSIEATVHEKSDELNVSSLKSDTVIPSYEINRIAQPLVVTEKMRAADNITIPEVYTKNVKPTIHKESKVFEFPTFREVKVGQPYETERIGKFQVALEERGCTTDLAVSSVNLEKAKKTDHPKYKDFDVAVLTKSKVSMIYDTQKCVQPQISNEDLDNTCDLVLSDIREEKIFATDHKEFRDFNIAVSREDTLGQAYETQKIVEPQDVEEEILISEEMILSDVSEEKATVAVHQESKDSVVALLRKDEVNQPYESQRIIQPQVITEEACLAMNLVLQDFQFEKALSTKHPELCDYGNVFVNENTIHQPYEIQQNVQLQVAAERTEATGKLTLPDFQLERVMTLDHTQLTEFDVALTGKDQVSHPFETERAVQPQIAWEDSKATENVVLPNVKFEKAQIFHHKKTKDAGALAKRGKAIQQYYTERTVMPQAVPELFEMTKDMAVQDVRIQKASVLDHEKSGELGVAVIRKQIVSHPFETQRALQSQVVLEEVETTKKTPSHNIPEVTAISSHHNLEEFGVAVVKKGKVIQSHETKRIVQSQTAYEEMEMIADMALGDVLKFEKAVPTDHKEFRDSVVALVRKDVGSRPYEVQRIVQPQYTTERSETTEVIVSPEIYSEEATMYSHMEPKESDSVSVRKDKVGNSYEIQRIVKPESVIEEMETAEDISLMNTQFEKAVPTEHTQIRNVGIALDRKDEMFQHFESLQNVPNFHQEKATASEHKSHKDFGIILSKDKNDSQPFESQRIVQSQVSKENTKAATDISLQKSTTDDHIGSKELGLTLLRKDDIHHSSTAVQGLFTKEEIGTVEDMIKSVAQLEEAVGTYHKESEDYGISLWSNSNIYHQHEILQAVQAQMTGEDIGNTEKLTLPEVKHKEAVHVDHQESRDFDVASVRKAKIFQSQRTNQYHISQEEGETVEDLSLSKVQFEKAVESNLRDSNEMKFSVTKEKEACQPPEILKLAQHIVAIEETSTAGDLILSDIQLVKGMKTDNEEFGVAEVKTENVNRLYETVRTVLPKFVHQGMCITEELALQGAQFDKAVLSDRELSEYGLVMVKNEITQPEETLETFMPLITTEERVFIGDISSEVNSKKDERNDSQQSQFSDVSVVMKDKIDQPYESLMIMQPQVVEGDIVTIKDASSQEIPHEKALFLDHQECKDFDVAVVKKETVKDVFQVQRKTQPRFVTEETFTTKDLFLPNVTFEQLSSNPQEPGNLDVAVAKKDDVIECRDISAVVQSRIITEEMKTASNITLSVAEEEKGKSEIHRDSTDLGIATVRQINVTHPYEIERNVQHVVVTESIKTAKSMSDLPYTHPEEVIAVDHCEDKEFGVASARETTLIQPHEVQRIELPQDITDKINITEGMASLVIPLERRKTECLDTKDIGIAGHVTHRVTQPQISTEEPQTVREATFPIVGLERERSIDNTDSQICGVTIEGSDNASILIESQRERSASHDSALLDVQVEQALAFEYQESEDFAIQTPKKSLVDCSLNTQSAIQSQIISTEIDSKTEEFSPPIPIVYERCLETTHQGEELLGFKASTQLLGFDVSTVFRVTGNVEGDNDRAAHSQLKERVDNAKLPSSEENSSYSNWLGTDTVSNESQFSKNLIREQHDMSESIADIDQSVSTKNMNLNVIDAGKELAKIINMQMEELIKDEEDTKENKMQVSSSLSDKENAAMFNVSFEHMFSGSCGKPKEESSESFVSSSDTEKIIILDRVSDELRHMISNLEYNLTTGISKNIKITPILARLEQLEQEVATIAKSSETVESSIPFKFDVNKNDSVVSYSQSELSEKGTEPSCDQRNLNNPTQISKMPVVLGKEPANLNLPGGLSPTGETNGVDVPDALTDVEDLLSDGDQSPLMKRKVTLVVPQKDTGAITDTEDMDFSGEEDEYIQEKKNLPTIQDLGLLPEPTTEMVNLTEGFLRRASPLLSGSESEVEDVEGRHKKNLKRMDTLTEKETLAGEVQITGDTDPEKLTDEENVEASGDEVEEAIAATEDSLPEHYLDQGEGISNKEKVNAVVPLPKVFHSRHEESSDEEQYHKQKPKRKTKGGLKVEFNEEGTTDVEDLVLSDKGGDTTKKEKSTSAREELKEKPKKKKQVRRKVQKPVSKNLATGKNLMTPTGDAEGLTDVEILTGDDEDEIDEEEETLLAIPDQDDGALTDCEDVEASDTEDVETFIAKPVPKLEPAVLPLPHAEKVKISETEEEGRHESGDETDEEGFELADKDDEKPLIPRNKISYEPIETVERVALDVEEPCESALTDTEDFDMDDKEEEDIIIDFVSRIPEEGEIYTLKELEGHMGSISKTEMIRDVNADLKQQIKDAEKEGLTLQEALNEDTHTDVEDLDEDEKPRKPKKKQRKENDTDEESVTESDIEEEIPKPTKQGKKKGRRLPLAPQISEVRFIETEQGPLSIIITPDTLENKSGKIIKDQVANVVFLEKDEIEANTDVEDLGLTDEEGGGKCDLKAPASSQEPTTDTEDLDFDPTDLERPISPLPPNVERNLFSSPKRELIQIKEDKYGVPQVTIRKLEKDELQISDFEDGGVTDTEDIEVSEGEALRIVGVTEDDTSDFELPDSGKVEVSSRTIQKAGLQVEPDEDGGSTDVEELPMTRKQRRKPKAQSKLVAKIQEDSHTDVEFLSDQDDKSNLKVRTETPGAHTDVEDLETSETEELDIPSHDNAPTPDIITKSAIRKVVTLKEGPDGTVQTEESELAPPRKNHLHVEDDAEGVTDVEDMEASGAEDDDLAKEHPPVELPEGDASNVNISEKSNLPKSSNEAQHIKDNLLLPEDNYNNLTDVESLGEGEGTHEATHFAEQQPTSLSHDQASSGLPTSGTKAGSDGGLDDGCPEAQGMEWEGKSVDRMYTETVVQTRHSMLPAVDTSEGVALSSSSKYLTSADLKLPTTHLSSDLPHPTNIYSLDDSSKDLTHWPQPIHSSQETPFHLHEIPLVEPQNFDISPSSVTKLSDTLPQEKGHTKSSEVPSQMVSSPSAASLQSESVAPFTRTDDIPAASVTFNTSSNFMSIGPVSPTEDSSEDHAEIDRTSTELSPDSVRFEQDILDTKTEDEAPDLDDDYLPASPVLGQELSDRIFSAEVTEDTDITTPMEMRDSHTERDATASNLGSVEDKEGTDGKVDIIKECLPSDLMGDDSFTYLCQETAEIHSRVVKLQELVDHHKVDLQTARSEAETIQNTIDDIQEAVKNSTYENNEEFYNKTKDIVATISSVSDNLSKIMLKLHSPDQGCSEIGSHAEVKCSSGETEIDMVNAESPKDGSPSDSNLRDQSLSDLLDSDDINRDSLEEEFDRLAAHLTLSPSADDIGGVSQKVTQIASPDGPLFPVSSSVVYPSKPPDALQATQREPAEGSEHFQQDVFLVPSEEKAKSHLHDETVDLDKELEIDDLLQLDAKVDSSVNNSQTQPQTDNKIEELHTAVPLKGDCIIHPKDKENAADCVESHSDFEGVVVRRGTSRTGPRPTTFPLCLLQPDVVSCSPEAQEYFRQQQEVLEEMGRQGQLQMDVTDLRDLTSPESLAASNELEESDTDISDHASKLSHRKLIKSSSSYENIYDKADLKAVENQDTPSTQKLTSSLGDPFTTKTSLPPEMCSSFENLYMESKDADPKIIVEADLLATKILEAAVNEAVQEEKLISDTQIPATSTLIDNESKLKATISGCDGSQQSQNVVQPDSGAGARQAPGLDVEEMSNIMESYTSDGSDFFTTTTHTTTSIDPDPITSTQITRITRTEIKDGEIKEEVYEEY